MRSAPCGTSFVTTRSIVAARRTTSRTRESTSTSLKPHSERSKNLSGTQWGEESDVERRLYVGSAVAIKAGGGDSLRENDANRNEDRAAAGSKRHSNFHTRAFLILIAAAEADAAFRQILADHDFFLKAAAADAGEHTRLDAGAVAAGNDAVLHGGLVGSVGDGPKLRLGLDPNGRRLAMLA